MVDVGKMKARLESRLDELRQDAKQLDATLREPDPVDDEDRATEIEGDEVLEGLGNAALAEIEAIEAALVRIENGTYGECTVCGEEISPQRLEAVPTAPKCINCAGG